MAFNLFVNKSEENRLQSAIECFGKSDMEGAIHHFDHVADKEWNDNVYYLYGSANEHLGRFEEAIIAYSNGFEKYPENNDLLAGLGSVYEKAGNIHDALAAYSRLIERKAEPLDVHYNSRGNLLMAKGEPEDALADINKACEINKANLDAINSKGMLLGKMGQYQQAIEVLNQGITIDPEARELCLNRGIMYCQMNRFQEGIHDFDHASLLDPEDAYPLKNKAIALYKLKEYGKALDVVNAAIDLAGADDDLLSLKENIVLKMEEND